LLAGRRAGEAPADATVLAATTVLLVRRSALHFLNKPPVDLTRVCNLVFQHADGLANTLKLRDALAQRSSVLVCLCTGFDGFSHFCLCMSKLALEHPDLGLELFAV
jgi:hypothetical protein